MKILLLFPKNSICFIFLICLFACNSDPKLEEENVTSQPIDYYIENHRPQFHFSPEKMWMNDPNGLVYHNGEYHLFYQYYPDSTVWGPMHWGHAVSEDLVHWEHLPIALYPDSLGYIFSGSAVIDQANSSGFGTDEKPAMVAIFTHHDMEKEKAEQIDVESQSIAYSTDKGRTWTKYEGNPVIPNAGIRDFRDPKVIWHEASERWIMVFAAQDQVKIYSSLDLKNWEFESDFGLNYGSQGRPWECPDLFPLQVEGSGETKWVMLVSVGNDAPNGGSGTQYFIGDFDGKKFSSDYPKEQTLWLDWGRDNYAGVTWSDIPEDDGRRILIGWMSNWQYAQNVPTETWRSAMTLPRALSLRETKDGVRLFSEVVEEMKKLRGEKRIMDQDSSSFDLSNSLAELVLNYNNEYEDDIFFRLSNEVGDYLIFGYDARVNSYFVDRKSVGRNDFSNQFSGKHYAERRREDEEMNLHIFIDRASIEIFADDGETVLTEIFFPTEDFTRLDIATEAKLESGVFYELESIWR